MTGKRIALTRSEAAWGYGGSRPHVAKPYGLGRLLHFLVTGVNNGYGRSGLVS
jgi:hypothetical protein